MSILHRFDFILMLAGWVDNPFSRCIERAFWRGLEADMAAFRTGRTL